MYDLARTARDLLAVDIGGARGARAVLARLTDLLFAGDFEIFEQIASISESNHANLVGCKPGRSWQGGLLLSASLGLGEGEPPSSPSPEGRVTLSGGRLWGPGAATGRLALLCQIMAASSFRPEELRRPVMVAGTFGGEQRGSGAQFLLESGQLMPEWVVVGAPTNLEIVRAHRGYLVFEVDVVALSDPWRHGFPVRSSHHVTVHGVGTTSALPQAGRNALVSALSFLDSCAERGALSIHDWTVGPAVNRVPSVCEFALLSESAELPGAPPAVAVHPLPDGAQLGRPVTACLAVWRAFAQRLGECFRGRGSLRYAEFGPPRVLFNVGEMASTADGLRVRFDCRHLPGEEPFALFQAVERSALTLAGELPDCRLDVRVTVNRPALDSPPESELANAAVDVLVANRLLPVRSTLAQYSDAAMYASCELDTIAWGPGWWGDGATPGAESVALDHLVVAYKVYRGLIERLCC